MAADAPKPRIRMPETAKAGEIVEVRTLINHAMERGKRKDSDGNSVPRKIINRFQVTFNGVVVLSADWYGAIASNPFQSFYLRVTETGMFRFEWTDDDGTIYVAEQMVTVE